MDEKRRGPLFEGVAQVVDGAIDDLGLIYPVQAACLARYPFVILGLASVSLRPTHSPSP
jgi:hypothetical protein